MNNYLYPVAIENYLKNKLKQLPIRVRHHLFNQLVTTIRQRHDCAKPIDVLPKHAPEWAMKAHANSTIHAFVASDDLNQSILALVSFAKEILLVQKYSTSSYAQQQCQRILAIFERGSLSDMKTARQTWLINHHRPEILAGIYENKETFYVDNAYWLKCQSLEQMHQWGKRLGEGCCLAGEYYDDAFIHRYEEDFALFGLFDEDHQFIAAAAFKEGALEDVEGQGDTRDERQQQVQSIQQELYLLLNEYAYVVDPTADNALIKRTNICGQSWLGEPLQEENGLTLWLDANNNTFILYHHHDERYFILDDQYLPCDPHRSYPLHSFTSMLAENIEVQHTYCRFFAQAAQEGLFNVEYLTQFDEFASDGTYWKDARHSKNTKIGVFAEYDGCVWWLNNADNRLYRWYDENMPVYYDEKVFALIQQRVKATYTHPRAFWNTLFSLGIALPDFAINDDLTISLTYTPQYGTVLSPEQGWVYQDTISNDDYCVEMREVDSVEGQNAQQWICSNQQGTVVSAILVTELSERKCVVSLNSVGCDPQAYALLRAAISTNSYTVYDDSRAPRIFDKPLHEYLLKKRNAAPILPTERFSDIPFTFTHYGNLTYIFNTNDEIEMLIKTDKQKEIVDAHTLRNPQAINDAFYQIISQLGFGLSEQFNTVANDYSHRVIDSMLSPMLPPPELLFDDIDIYFDHDNAHITYYHTDGHEQDIAITLSRCGNVQFDGKLDYDDQPLFAQLQQGVSQGAEYLGIHLPKDLEKAFALTRTDNGYKVTGSLPPPSWQFVSDEHGASAPYWQLDHDITLPAIVMKEGKLSCDYNDFDRVMTLQPYIHAFTNWYNK